MDAAPGTGEAAELKAALAALVDLPGFQRLRTAAQAAHAVVLPSHGRKSWKRKAKGDPTAHGLIAGAGKSRQQQTSRSFAP